MPTSPSVHTTAGAKNRLLHKVESLDDSTCQILETMVDALGCRWEEWIAPDTDIVDAAFARNFRERLQIHHATHEEPFNADARGRL